MRFRHGRQYLMRGDTLYVDGYEPFVVGENISFGTTEEVDNFLSNSKEIFFREYSNWFCLGGSSVRRKGLVRKN